MRRRSTLLVATVLGLGISVTAAYGDACSGHSHATGSVLGAVGGGVIGSAITNGSPVGVIGGAVAGGLAGNAVARDVDCGRGRHYERQSRRHYWYDHHGHRVYENRR